MSNELFKLVPSGFAVVRAPLLPIHAFLDWVEETTANNLDHAGSLLRALFDDPVMNEALLTASASLHMRVRTWRGSTSSRSDMKVAVALTKYLARMAYRCTPFGILAGVAWGQLNGRTELRIGARESAKRFVRLDFGYLSALASTLERRVGIREHLTYVANPTLHKLDGKWYFAEPDYSRQSLHIEHGSADSNLFLDLLIAETSKRAVAWPELRQMLKDADPDLSENEIESFLGELLDGQIFMSSLRPTATGGDALARMIVALSVTTTAKDIVSMLKACQAELAALTDSPLGTETQRYAALNDHAVRLTEGKQVPKDVLQIDLRHEANAASIAPDLLDDLTDTISFLHRVAVDEGWPELNDFRKQFEERYGERDVPLLEALDPETGIGFAEDSHYVSPLLDGIASSAGNTPPLYMGVHNAFSVLLFRKFQEAIERGLEEIVIRSEDFPSTDTASRRPLPDSLCAVITVLGRPRDPEKSDRSSLVLHAVDGPPGAKWLGRFCYMDKALEDAVRLHLAQEEALEPASIFAEIVHIPEGRVGNVLVRPVLREHEIPIFGRSEAASQLALSDLLISVQKDSVRLQSRSLGAYVQPRLTTAHNFQYKSLGLYKFLAMLARQHCFTPSFKWPEPLPAMANRLPRVRYNRTILAPACWFVRSNELSHIAQKAGSERYADFANWRLQARIPRMVAIQGGDHQLPLDLENSLCIECFLVEAGRTNRLCIKEILDLNHELIATSPAGAHTNEVVVPFVLKKQAGQSRPASTTAGTRDNAPAQRAFSPCVEWHYLKLYTTAGMQNRVLVEHVRPLVTSLLKSGTISRWFFIRYADPKPHLRLRLQARGPETARSLDQAVKLFLSDILARGAAHRVALDTYDRELERYGGVDGLSVSEDIFHQDSSFVLTLLDHIGPTGGDLLWKCGAAGVDSLARAFVPGDDLATLYGRLCLANRQNTRKAEKVQLDVKFRALREPLARVLAGSSDEIAFLSAPLTARHSAISTYARELDRLHATGLMNRAPSTITPSYLHLFMNRLCANQPNRHEAVLYELLLRHYHSARARYPHALSTNVAQAGKHGA